MRKTPIQRAIERMETQRIATLDFTRTYQILVGGEGHIFGPSYVRTKAGDPLWWAWCASCRHVNLYDAVTILRGQYCTLCVDSLGLMLDETKQPHPRRRIMKPVAMEYQEPLCTALLLGGYTAAQLLAESWP